MEKTCGPSFFLLWLTALTVLAGNSTVAAKDESQLVVNQTGMNLQVIPGNDNMTAVTTLDMSGNMITLNEMDRKSLETYPSLEKLYLDNNMVTSVAAECFSKLPNLRLLSLSRNNISSLNSEAFSGLNALTELDLSHNQLTELPLKLTASLNKLQVIHLQGNPWNCSCSLLSTMGKMTAVIGAPNILCASPAEQARRSILEATASCSTLPPVTSSTSPQKTTIPSQQPPRSTVGLQSTANQNTRNSTDRPPVGGNTWKFTASVGVLALTTSVLIVTAVKGPSWYKSFYNYRHRQLRDEDEEEEDRDNASTVFSVTGDHQTHQTFTFEEEHNQIQEEEEDGFFEDPYIKREDPEP
ncbi:leucine-rich repeat-containing protein 19 isoform X2 [Oryzias melastigma]|nr:leucine-rich repeat-containing protein 19 isoform X2 [Oryzias melastigma]